MSNSPRITQRICRAFVVLLVVSGTVISSASSVSAELGEARIDSPRAQDATKISAGGNHTCAILTDSTLWCWGDNDYGQLGLNDTTDRSSPVRVGTASNWRAVSAGNNSSTCAVNTLNEVFCWGFNVSGQTGVASSTNPVRIPTKVAALGTTVQSVSVGSTSACVVNTSGAVLCWGNNANGQLGNGIAIGNGTITPTAVANLPGTYSVVAVGTDGACALNTLKVAYCWGTDLFGQRGDGAGQTSNTVNPSTVVVSANENVAALIAGYQSNCIIMEHNSATRCWGQNTNNYLSANVGNLESPVAVGTVSAFSGKTARAFSVGADFACMLVQSNGSIACSGKNDRNQVTNAPTGINHLVVTTGFSHACAVRLDQRLVCWGNNSDGRVGNGAIETSATASVVTFGTNAVQTVGAEPVMPSAPNSITVEGRYQALNVSWTAPTSSGTSYVSSYEYRLSSNGGTSYGSWVSVVGGLSTRVTGLATATSYLVQVRAVSVEGAGAIGTASSAVATLTPCDPKNNCSLGSIGPGGGLIVYDAGASNSTDRFIEAAPFGWNGSTTDPSNNWNTALVNSLNYAGGWAGWALPTSTELVAIANNYNANNALLAEWPIADANEYWSSTEFDADFAYAGSEKTDKSWYKKYRPVRYHSGPTRLAAPVVTATAANLTISVSWTAPSTTNNGAITDYETRLSTNGGSTWGAWTSRGIVTSLELTGLSSGTSYRVQVRAVNGWGGGLEGQSAVITITSGITPATQTVNGTINIAITPTTALTATNFGGTVSYAVTTGSLPTGLSLSSSTGVISGTPTATSSATVTITATGSSSGSATTTVTFAITTAPPGIVEGVWAIDGLNAVVLEWYSPTTGEPATSYEYATSTDGGQSFSTFQAVPTPLSTATSVTSQTKLTASISSGLTRGVDTIIQMRALNGTTPGPVFPDPSTLYWDTWSPRATAKISDSCNPMINCEVGEVGPGGGIIVFDNGSNAAWGRYLEAAPAFWNGTNGDPLASFGCLGTRVTGALGIAQRAIGTGAVNTAAIMAACSTSGIAARLADAYSSTALGQTFSDWHLPSSEELVKVYQYRQRLGGWKFSVNFNGDNNYTSSSDFSNDYFYGLTGTRDKMFSSHVRPVRYVMGPNAPSAPGLIATVTDGQVDLFWNAPTDDGGSAVSEYHYRLSSDGGTTWGSWISLGLNVSHSETSLVNGQSYVFELRATNRGGTGSVSSTGVMAPGTPKIDWSVGTSATVPSPFATENLGSGATYSISNGTLPDGLSLDPTTGVISGTPTVEGDVVVTLTASVGDITASVIVQIQISPAPTPAPTPSDDSLAQPMSPESSNDTGLTFPPIDTTVRTSDDATKAPQQSNNTSPTAPSGSESELVTPSMQEILTAPDGGSKILLGGVLINVDVVQVSTDLRSVPEAERTAGQIAELRDIAKIIVNQIQVLLGTDKQSPISMRETTSGAVIVGLLVDSKTGKKIDVPVEHVVLIRGGGLVLMVAGRKGSEPARIGSDGVLEISQGGSVSVLAYGLTPGVTGEVVVMSTPRRITSFKVSNDGGVAAHATLPSDLSAGNHTVVVTVGDEAASLGFRIIGDRDENVLPRSGSNSTNLVLLALTLLLMGAILVNKKRNSLRSFTQQLG
jgi:alpha-tubulin suppressor-like RCC1 family protein